MIKFIKLFLILLSSKSVAEIAAKKQGITNVRDIRRGQIVDRWA